MSTQRGIIVQGKGKAALVSDHPIPPLRPDTVLVKAICVALNPHDWKAIDYLDVDGCGVGCDFSGVVVETSGGAMTRQFVIGDRIMGTVHGSEHPTADLREWTANSTRPSEGAFQEYIVARSGVCTKIPDNLSYEDAATPNVAIVTCALALYHILKLPALDGPPQASQSILVYGGSTATGTMAIQYAKLFGLTVLTTCSPRNFDLVRSRGADHIYDYRDSSSISEIKRITNNDLTYVFDCIGEGSAPDFCYEAMGRKALPDTYVTVAPRPLSRPGVEIRSVNGLACYGEDCEINASSLALHRKMWASPQDYALCAEFYEATHNWLAAGRLKTHPADVREGGLEGILEGLRELKEGNVSGKKLVYRIGAE